MGADAPMSLDALPREIPIFPLAGALLLPRGQMPLNIFEPRYLAMTKDAIAGDGMIGMIQPRWAEREDPADRPDVYDTGCLGQIVSSRETDDGRILITLAGLIRFEVDEELPLRSGYRRVVPRYDRFAEDLRDPPGDVVDRPRLMLALRAWLASREITADWSTIEETPDERLITVLSMTCPFEPNEKQALLESPDLHERSRVMTALIEMSLMGGDEAPTGRH